MAGPGQQIGADEAARREVVQQQVALEAGVQTAFELRGPGELFGTKQTGLAQMRVADLLRDADLLPKVQAAAELMLARNEANIPPLLRRWTGSGERFGRV